MRTRPAIRSSRAVVFLVVSVIALGGCGTASPSPTTAAPTSTAPGRTLAPPSSASPWPSIAPATPPETPASSPAAVADTWVRLDDMSVPREALMALELLDGRIFVIDATEDVISDLEGPPDDPGPTDLLFVTTGRWTPAAPLNAPRSAFIAVRLDDGRVLVTGGNNGWYGAYSSTKLFDPATERWTATGLLDTARIGPAGALLADGRVLVAGGTYAEGYRDQKDFESGSYPDERTLRSAEIYDPRTGRWSKARGLHDAGSAGVAFTLSDGRVLAVGPPSETPSTVEIYDPIADTWADAGTVVWPPASMPVLLADDSLLIIGGATSWEWDRAMATVRRFDPDAGTTVEVAPLPAPRMDAVAVRLADGDVLVAGGMERRWLEAGRLAPRTATAFRYDPALDRWTETTPMPFAASPAAALLLSDGSVVVAGGSVPNPDAETDTDTPSSSPIGWSARFVPGTATGD